MVSLKKFSLSISVILILVMILTACELPGLGIANPEGTPPALQTLYAAQSKGNDFQVTEAAIQTVAALATQVAKTEAARELDKAISNATPMDMSNQCDWGQLLGEQIDPKWDPIPPNAAFKKYWRFKNIGTCTWTTKYTITFYSGSEMGAPQTSNLPKDVAPGETVDIIFDLKAPATAGRYTGVWKIRNAKNLVVGIGDQSNGSFDASIKVGGPTLTPSLTASPTFTTTPSPTMTVNPGCEMASLVIDVSVPDGTRFTPNTIFNKTWRIKNVGNCTWSTDYTLYFDAGDQMSAPQDVKLSKYVLPGQTIDVTVPMKAPAESGTYLGRWKLKNADGFSFGTGTRATDPVIVKIVVSSSGGILSTITQTPSKTSSGPTKTPQPTATGPTRTRTSTKTKTNTPPPPPPPSVWEVSYSPVDEVFRDISAVSASDAWIVGEYGTVMHWNGSNWSQVELKQGDTTLYNDIFAVHMISGSDVWLGGTDLIEHYDGSSWTRFSTPNDDTLRDIDSISSNDVWAVGNSGAILHYTGSGWSSVTSPTSLSLYGISMVSASDGWAVGDNGIILHYNAGSWMPVTSPVNHRINAVHMNSASDGWAVTASGYALRWNGSNWSSTSISSKSLNAISMTSPSSGWAMGSSASAVEYASSKWNTRSIPTSNNIYGIHILSSTEGWAVGDNGTIIRLGKHNTPTPTKTGTNTKTPTSTKTATNTKSPTNTRTPTNTGTATKTATATNTSVPAAIYNFGSNTCSANWTNSSGALSCPGSAGDAAGSVQGLSSVKMEDGNTYNSPSIVLQPQQIENGYISGTFTGLPEIQSGDIFRATVGCADNVAGCLVEFNLTCDSTSISNLQDSNTEVDNISLDLSSLAGTSPTCSLKLTNVGAAYDQNIGVWINPRIER